MSLQTSYPFVLPRGYVDASGTLHKEGRMRLATARDELEPLRDPTITGPDDPRLTVLVLARVVEKLGTVELITTHEIENLFAIDLAFLQDFYGVINFGNQDEYEALLRAQSDGPPLLGQSRPVASPAVSPQAPVEPAASSPADGDPDQAEFDGGDAAEASGAFGGNDPFGGTPFGGSAGFGERALSRRGAIEEIPRAK